MCRRAFLLLVFAWTSAPILCCSCRSDNLTNDAAQKAASFREHEDYESLKWLSDNALQEGMRLAEVESLLGPSEEYYTGDPKRVRMYTCERAEPFGDILIMHLRNGRLESWEWADE